MPSNLKELKDEFLIELKHCRQLYSRAATIVAIQNSHLVDGKPSEFLAMMQDFYDGLMLKLFCSTAYSDQRLSKNEEQLASILLHQLYGKRLRGEPMREALSELVPYSETLDWQTLVEPFVKYSPLKVEVVALETALVRLMNMIVKADGQTKPQELRRLSDIQNALMNSLRVGIEAGRPDHEPVLSGENMNRQAQKSLQSGESTKTDSPQATVQVPEHSLEEALDDLNELVGLDTVKAEVSQLTNFIKVQQLRKQEGLAQNKLSLHMVFGGNPGTGKTTVARILGRIYGAMGVLATGHLVETDRSGLVAEYSGQTGPKTNKVIDSALDGVLFIDEAYSLVADSGDDPFGHEAVQTLLKRMEDDRNRLIVILAGYPAEMTTLLESNPGLSSRFAHRVDFDDYTPNELARIWLLIAKKNEYSMNAKATAKLLLGLQHLFDRKDKHFGNGRLVRNTFEKTIRYLADRIVNVTPITRELLTQIEAEDIRFEQVPSEELSDQRIGAAKFSVQCPRCGKESSISAEHFCRNFKCSACEHEFKIVSGTPRVGNDQSQ